MSELREKIKAQYGDSWAALSDQEKNGVLSRGAVEQIQSYDLSSIATNIGLATLQFNLAGGSGRLFALAGQPETAPFAFMVRNERSGYFESVLGALGEADLSLLLIWVLAMGYVVIARIVGMFGVYGLLREKQYANLFIIVSGICYFALIFPFFGISRFRVNVESLFVVLFVAGLFFLRHRRSGRPGL